MTDSEISPNDAEETLLRALAALKAGKANEGADLLRQAAFAGHPEAQNQLARLYFSALRHREDLADLEASAQSGDHVALFVLAMSFLDGHLVDKDEEKALLALRKAAHAGNYVAMQMLQQANNNGGLEV